MKTRVLDSWPIIEWINGRQPATDGVAGLFSAAGVGKARVLMSAINVGEVYYFLMKQQQRTAAETWRRAAPTLPVTIDIPSVEDIWAAAELKGRFPISYADAFAAGLAQRCRCPVVTGDPEFRSIRDLELHWIGR